IGLPPGNDPAYVRVAACALTFIAVTSAWVLFRASSLGSAGTMLSAMYGMEGEHGIQGLVEYGRSQWSLLHEFRWSESSALWLLLAVLLWQIYSRRCSLQIHFRQCGHRCGGSRAKSSMMAWRTA